MSDVDYDRVRMLALELATVAAPIACLKDCPPGGAGFRAALQLCGPCLLKWHIQQVRLLLTLKDLEP